MKNKHMFVEFEKVDEENIKFFDLVMKSICIGLGLGLILAILFLVPKIKW